MAAAELLNHFSVVTSLICPIYKDAETDNNNSGKGRLLEDAGELGSFLLLYVGKPLPHLRLCFVKCRPVPNNSHSHN